jgi:predicted acylesterase/phospholipase RssA
MTTPGTPVVAPPRIGVVLSAGGLRGVAHLGVIRRLVEFNVPIDVLVGVSAGAIIAGYYAGVGMTVDDLMREAPAFKGGHLVAHALGLRAPAAMKPFFRRFSGVIPRRLEELDAAHFARLHHGISRLGIVCHDILTNAPVYYSSLEDHGARLSDVVRASAAVPRLFPPRVMQQRERIVHLVDGGVSDSLPIDFARTVLGAKLLIVSDCRGVARTPPEDPNLIYMRPDPDGTGILRSPAGTLVQTVRSGERAVTPAIIERIRSWIGEAGVREGASV